MFRKPTLFRMFAERRTGQGRRISRYGFSPAEETERMALSLPCTERNVETESVRCTDSGSLEARIVYIGKERTLLICHDGNGKEKDFYALAEQPSRSAADRRCCAGREGAEG